MAKTLKRDASGLDTLDPTTVHARDAESFRRILLAREQVAVAEESLREAVRAARLAGDSWTIIGAALDISRQAAQQRFGHLVSTGSTTGP